MYATTRIAGNSAGVHRLGEETDRRYAEWLPRKEDELARANQRADVDRLDRLDEEHREEQRSEDQCLDAEEERRREAHRNRQLISQIERRQLRPHQRNNSHIKAVHSKMPNRYPRNFSAPLVTGSPLENQFRSAESRDVAMDLIRNARLLGLACGGAPPMDTGTVISHMLVGLSAGRRRVPARYGDAGVKFRRTGEEEEEESPTEN